METTSTTRRAPLLAAAAAMALGALAAGCQAYSAAFMYAQEAHAREVEAWCYRNFVGHKTPSLIRQCVQQAWINVPPGECDIGLCTGMGHVGRPYDAGPWRTYK